MHSTFLARPVCLAWVALLALTTAGRAGTFTADFATGLPPGTALFGSAAVEEGVLKLTKTANSQTGAMLVGDLDTNRVVAGFTATFNLLIGGGNAADGFSFNFAGDLPDAAFGEEGAGSGLSVCFDTYDNGGGEAPAIDVKVGGGLLASLKGIGPQIRSNVFQVVRIELRPSGLVSVSMGDLLVCTNLMTGHVPQPGRFGFGARTGGLNDNHWVDDVNLQTTLLPAGSVFAIEAEHFNFDGGQAVAAVSTMPYAGNEYDGLSAVAEVDYHAAEQNGNGEVYRRGENPNVPLAESLGGRWGKSRLEFDVTSNYRIGWVSDGEWYNYTRALPAGVYRGVAAMSFGDGAAHGMRGRLGLVLGAASTTNQVVADLGWFDAAGSGSWGNNNLVPVAGPDNAPGLIVLSGGTNTLRFTTGSGDFDWFALWRTGDVPAPTDLLVAAGVTGSTFQGNNVYQLLPAGEQDLHQPATVTAAAGFAVKVQNDGPAPRSVRVRAVENAEPQWAVVYRLGTQDITAAIAGPAGYVLTNQAAGAEGLIAVTLAANPRTLGGSVKQVRLSVYPAPEIVSPSDTLRLRATNEVRVMTDLLVRRDADANFLGDNVYNATGAGQSRRTDLEGGGTVRYVVQIANDGNVPTEFLVQGPAAPAGWTVKYTAVAGGTDVTGEVTGAGWKTPVVAPFATVELGVQVTPGLTVPNLAALDLLIAGAAVSDPAKLDAVKLTTVALQTLAQPVAASYTTTADFEKGRLLGVEAASVADQLQLTKDAVTLPFLWVPNSNEGTVSKIDTRTGRELGRYRVSPGANGQPSRTTVDLLGNCWVANRQIASAVKIGLLENGQWIDRNSNGVPDTSQDTNGDGLIQAGEILPWGADECVLWEVLLVPGREGTYVPGTLLTGYADNYWNPGPRGIAVDAAGNVWIGTHDTKMYYYIDGVTAAILRTIDVSSVDHTAYGALIDGQGILWSSGNHRNHVLRLDPRDFSFVAVPIGHWVYGIGLDRSNHLFATGADDRRITRLDVVSTNKEWTATGYGRGVAVTDDGDLWTPDSAAGTVTRWSNGGILKATIPVGADPTGVSVDAAGKVWVVMNGDENIKRIDPATDTVDLIKTLPGTRHYGYSDMTGIIARNATTRFGVWAVVHNAQLPDSVWGAVTWTATDPAGGGVSIRVRSSNDRRTWSPWEPAVNGQGLARTPPGQFLELEATLQAAPDGSSPLLKDVAVAVRAPAEVDLAILKSATPSPVLAEHVLTYALTVTNRSAQWAAQVQARDVVPAGLAFQGIRIPGGSYELKDGVLTCRWAGLAGASGVTAWLDFRPAAAGRLTNRVTVASSNRDSNTNDNAATLVTEVLPLVCLPAPVGLAAWWPGDGDAEEVARGWHGTLQGGTRFGPAAVGTGFVFDSDDDRVVIPPQPAFNVGEGGFAVEFWMRGVKNQPQSLATVLDKSHGYVDSTGWAFQLESATGRLLLHTGAGGGGASNFPEVAAPLDVLDDRFHHVVAVWDDTDIVHLYVDGVERGTNVVHAPAGNDRALNFGFAWGNGGPQRFFRGILDEVSIYRTALSPAQVLALYDTRSVGKCVQGVALIAPETLPRGWVGQDFHAAFRALGQLPFAYTVSQGALPPGLVLSPQGVLAGRPTAAGSSTFTVQVADATGAQTQREYVLRIGQCEPPLPGLVGWWPGDGHADDLVSTNHGVLQNGTTYGAGLAREAFAFDGLDDRVLIPESPAIDLSRTNAWTIAAWIRPASYTGQRWPTIYSEGRWGASLGLNENTGKLESWINNGHQFVANAPVPLFLWSHVALVYDGTNRLFYLNGDLDATGPGPKPSGNSDGSAIGDVAGGPNSSRFLGKIDEVMVFTRALPPAELEQLVHLGASSFCPVQPLDLLIKRGAEPDPAYALNDLYQPVPRAEQVKTVVVAPQVVTVFDVRVQNDSDAPGSRTFLLRLVESPEPGWTVRGLAGTEDITARLRTGYLTPTLAAGATHTLSLQIAADRRVPGGTAKTLTLEGLLGVGASAVKDSVQIVATVAPTLQPDLLVRREADLNYLGLHLFNVTGFAQTKSIEVGPGETARYLVQLVNDGNLADAFTLTGPAGATGWQVRYFAPRAALRFDGGDDYVSTGSWTPGAQWTTEAWVAPISAPGGRRTILGGYADCRDWGLTFQDGLFGIVTKPPGGCTITLQSTNRPTLGQWHHLAGVCDGTNAWLYIDGRLEATGPVERNYQAVSTDVRIGGEACCGGNNFPGYIAQAAIWNRPLTAAEIQLRLTQWPAPDAPGLQGFWPLDEGAGTVARDLSPVTRTGTLANGPRWDVLLDGEGGGLEVTEAVTGAGWPTGTLAVGAGLELIVEVTPAPDRPGGASQDVLLLATSIGAASARDAIKAVTTVVRPAVDPVGGTFTTSADFERGRLVGVEYAAVPDQLQLAGDVVTLPFIWVPNSNEGTISKVDTRTGRELGRYRVSPRTDSNPSRTTVDLYGNCWVGNRQTATAVKVGLLENGQYIDRNGNGIVETSRDLNGDGDITGAELLDWGKDECVLFEVLLVPGKEGTYVPGTPGLAYANDYWNPGPRGFAVDKQNNVWVGTWGTSTYYYLDGATAAILKQIDVRSVNHTAYGAVIDPRGILWSASLDKNHVFWLNPADDTFGVIPMGHQVYGMGLDRQNHLFIAGWQNAKLSRVDTLTRTKEWTVNGVNESRGVAVTEDGDVWTANSAPGTVTRWSNDGAIKAHIPVGNTPTGVAVDAAGKVWVVNYGDNFIKRIDPFSNTVDLAKPIVGANHYGYSDMTGIMVRNVSTRIGFWTVIHDARALRTPWGTVSWKSLEPDGTLLKVRVRSSDDRQSWSLWEPALNGAPLRATPPGRFLELDVTFQSSNPQATPVLYDLTVTPAGQAIQGIEVYRNDFQADVGTEWSVRTTDLTPTGGRRFLGQFGNQGTTLALSNLPPHVAVTVLYDLFVLRTWDGNRDLTGTGPDQFILNLGGGLDLLRTTFNNGPAGSAASGQAYPGSFPGAQHPFMTGAAETNSLGFTYPGLGVMDSVYRLTHTFPHSADALVLNFLASGLTADLDDESWGLDNIRVYITPVSAPLQLLPIGFEPSGAFHLQILGERDKTVILQGSTDLRAWDNLSTNKLVSDRLDLLDAGMIGQPLRFYRALLQP